VPRGDDRRPIPHDAVCKNETAPRANPQQDKDDGQRNRDSHDDQGNQPNRHVINPSKVRLRRRPGVPMPIFIPPFRIETVRMDAAGKMRQERREADDAPLL